LLAASIFSNGCPPNCQSSHNGQPRAFGDATNSSLFAFAFATTWIRPRFRRYDTVIFHPELTGSIVFASGGGPTVGRRRPQASSVIHD
jgi:hypothetical protein